ncbi:PF14248 domain protein [Leptospira kmetyi serovar Malaysia str. Bejo-Iso9]|nr:PF14248 domain protein [Leptospira kmetyi serovar Malaysia str. Bejo-Iso9]
MVLGQPATTPRLDNVHRFMAGIYFSMGLICFWAAYTVRTQKTLVYLIAIGVWIAAIGRLVSISIVGLPEPAELWLGYLAPELLVPPILIFSQWKRKDLV